MKTAGRSTINVGWKRRFVAFVLGVVAAGLKSRRRFFGRSQSARQATTVLILEPYGMGDLISLEPLLRNLRDRYFEVRLSAQAAWRALYPELTESQWLDAQVPWSRYNLRDKYRWSSFRDRELRNYLRQLRRLGAGCIGIDPRGDIRSVLLLRLAGCGRVLSLQTYLGTNMRIPGFVGEVLAYPGDLKRWQVNLLFLQALGFSLPHVCAPPRFSHLAHLGNPQKRSRIGLIPVAPWSGKLWDRTQWTELARALTTCGWELLGICGPKQTEAAARELGGDVLIEECSDIRGLAGTLCSCRCVITVDSGPMHLADALGVPVIALFGQAKLPLWAPSGIYSQVISHQNDPDFSLCYPIEENAHLGRQFMSRISVDEVMAAVKRLEDRLGFTGKGITDAKTH